jgi:predicted MPP superfamily phosphohydrolase
VNRLEPALTVITGDFMTCHGPEQIDSVARLLEVLKPGPLGCFAVLGNHDYTIAWTGSDVADRLSNRLAGLGIQVLRNEVQVVEGLQLCGIDDYWGPHFQPRTALARIDTKRPALVLCHNPDAVDLSCWGEYRGWVLSGHTHGGQCKPPFLPPPILPVLNKRYTAGEFVLSNGRRLYINCGLGYVQRIRFNVRPEITLHRLVRANPDEPSAALEPRS